MSGSMKGVAYGLGFVCMIAGIVLIGMSLKTGGTLLIVGLGVVVAGLGAVLSASRLKN